MNTNSSTFSEVYEYDSLSLQQSLEKTSGAQVLEFFDTQKPQISVAGLDIDTSDKDYVDFEAIFNMRLDDFSTQLNPEYVGENIKEEIVFTWKYLQQKYEKSRGKLEVYGLIPEEVTNACIYKLLEQIQEASENGRKLINGRVASLLKYENDTLYMQEVPYYSFACSNVSLDEVQVGDRSLRDIAGLCGNTTDEGEFMLPNSLGICISVMSKDESEKPCIIAQDRNNATTLTQREAGKVVASASGAINISGGSTDIKGAAQEEVKEELGLSSDVHYLPDGANAMFTGNLDPIMRELGISKEDCDFEPKGLIMEDRRLNPEIVCSGYTSKNLSEIQGLWQTAESKNESLSITGVSLEEIGDNLAGEKETLGKHFLMSLLAWYGDTKRS